METWKRFEIFQKGKKNVKEKKYWDNSNFQIKHIMYNNKLSETVSPQHKDDNNNNYYKLIFTSANSRLVVHDLKSMVEPAIWRTASSGLEYSRGCRCSNGWNLTVEPLAGHRSR